MTSVPGAVAPLPSAFWRFWTAVSLSNLGDGLRLVAFPLLATTLTDDPRWVAGLVVVQALPWLVLGVPAGSVVDRADARRLMVGVNLVRTAALLALLSTVAAGANAALWMLYVVAFVVGLGETVYDTAAQAAIPGLVGAAQLERANGRLVSATVVTNEFAGPLLGAGLFSAGMLLPFGSHALLVLVAAVLLLGLPALVRPFPDPAADDFRTGGAGGLTWLRASAPMRVVLITCVVLVITDSAWSSLLVIYTIDVLGLPAAAYGMLLAAGAGGGLLGGLAAAGITARMGPGRVLLGAGAVAAGAQLLLGVTAVPLLAAVLLAASSGAFAVWNVASVTVSQRLVPPHLLGRVMGAFRTCTMSAAALGAAAGGAAAAGFGVRAPFLAGGAVLVAALLLAARPLLRHVGG